MIVYDLACGCGYIFEGWFQDREDFVAQQEAGFLSCPDCGNNAIRKILSPVNVSTTREPSTVIQDGDKESAVSPEVLLQAKEL
jgi:hypothetical protein